MSAESVVRGFLERVRSGKEPEAASLFLASTVLANQVVSGKSQSIERTPENYAEHVREFLQCFGPFELHIEEFLVQGAKVFVRWRQQGVHLAALHGFEATGCPLVTVCSAVYRVEDDRIVEYWIQQENDGLKAQLERNRKHPVPDARKPRTPVGLGYASRKNSVS